MQFLTGIDFLQKNVENTACKINSLLEDEKSKGNVVTQEPQKMCSKDPLLKPKFK